jgi:hypothetical protein
MSANDGHGSGPRAIAVPTAQSGETVRQNFGGTEIEKRAETASSTLAAQAEAAVKARFFMAFQRPRDIENVRVKILAACKRPLFAKGALYCKPVGKKKNPQTGRWEEAYAEGLSIRFAEEAVRCLGNAQTDSVTIYDDQKRRIVRVSATDLETNAGHSKDIVIEKTVERRSLKPGQLAVGQRINSYGEPVYIVESSDDELATKAGALGSKGLRDKILMLIPSDIQEEAKQQIRKTQANEDAKDPAAAKKAIIDSFAEYGVMPNQLAELLGHDLVVLQPAELQQLRAIYSAIKDGETTWQEVIDQARDGTESKVPPAAGTAAQPKASSLEDLAARTRANRDGAKPPSAQAGAAATKPAEPADSISRGPGSDPRGQQVTPVAAAKSTPVSAESDEDRAAREAAAPGPNEGPEPPSPTDADAPPWKKR